MGLDDIRYEVRLTLAQTNEAIHDARAILAEGADEEKVIAAGELDFLRRQKALLEMRLGQVERLIALHRRRRLSWLRQTWFRLVLSFESWIAHA